MIFQDDVTLGICSRAAIAARHLPREHWARTVAYHEPLADVSARTIRRAARICDYSPRLQGRVVFGELSIAAAEREIVKRAGQPLAYDPLTEEVPR